MWFPNECPCDTQRVGRLADTDIAVHSESLNEPYDDTLCIKVLAGGVIGFVVWAIDRQNLQRGLVDLQGDDVSVVVPDHLCVSCDHATTLPHN